MSKSNEAWKVNGTGDPTRPFLIVAGDSHAGPSLRHQLRDYCPAEILPDFDEYLEAHEQNKPGFTPGGVTLGHSEEELAEVQGCAGLQDPRARLLDMDESGISADIIFGGGQNNEPIPFMGMGFGAGDVKIDQRLRAAGNHIWNAWLADFCAVEPKRLVGVMQIPIWDIDATIKELEWGRNAGLTTVSFPAPRSDFPAYNDPAYEPFWSAIEDLDLPLLCHGGGGDPPLGIFGPAGAAMFLIENGWLTRRAMWEMMFSRVFERHPKLRVVFTEQRAMWLPGLLTELDSINYDPFHTTRGDRMTKPPSEVWRDNCGICISFMAPFEADLRHQVGMDNMVWGSDYPHAEGTWPHTRASIRHTFSHVPEAEARAILGENAVGIYHLDGPYLRDVADKIGPLPEEIATPLPDEEIPEYPGCAFRKVSSYH